MSSRAAFRAGARLRMALQDGPPAGGFKPIPTKRSLPDRGPSGIVIMGGVIGVMAWGWYLMAKTNLHQREVVKEKRACRLAVAPYLQVEDDMRESCMLETNKKLEAWVMSDVKDYKPGYENIYKGERYVSPIVKTL